MTESVALQNILTAYRDGIYDSMKTNHGVVAEYFDTSVDDEQARLLCQTRCIHYLSCYAQIYDDQQALSRALELYYNTHRIYYGETGWRARSGGTSDVAKTYDLAFVPYSFAILYSLTGDTGVKREAQRVYSQLMHLIQDERFYPQHIQYKNYVSQNPLMHLFESFITGYSVFEDERYICIAAHLRDLVENHFYNNKQDVINEVVHAQVME